MKDRGTLRTKDACLLRLFFEKLAISENAKIDFLKTLIKVVY